MQEKGTDAVESMRRVLTARRALAYLILGSLVLGGCGIGSLDQGGKVDKAAKKAAAGVATAQSNVVSEHFKKKMGGVAALPRGGPGQGPAPKRPASASATNGSAGSSDTTERKKGYKARFAAFFLNRPPRKRVPDVGQTPAKLRGRYAMSDSGDFFVPCNDTTRYVVQGTTEARYLMVEKLRFIVRGLKTPVYAVFTGTYVAAKPVAAAKDGLPENKSSTPTAGQRSPAPVVPAARKTIFVSKVDTLTTSFPNACRASSGNRSAGG